MIAAKQVTRGCSLVLKGIVTTHKNRVKAGGQRLCKHSQYSAQGAM